MIPIFTVSTDITAFQEQLETKRAALIIALINRVNMLNADLQSRIMGAVSGGVLQIRTGKLARSIEMIPAAVVGNGIEGSVQAGGGVAFYTRFQEEGTSGPYPIPAFGPLVKGQKMLAFEMGGKQVFFRRVMHPGLQGKHFVRDTFEAMKPEIVAGLQSVPGEIG